MLAVGDQAPSFDLPDADMNPVLAEDLVGRPYVLYFYPKDDTPGCTKEAQGFRDSYADYQGKDMVVLGVSMDDEASHKAFKEKYGHYFYECDH